MSDFFKFYELTSSPESMISTIFWRFIVRLGWDMNEIARIKYGSSLESDSSPSFCGESLIEAVSFSVLLSSSGGCTTVIVFIDMWPVYSLSIGNFFSWIWIIVDWNNGTVWTKIFLKNFLRSVKKLTSADIEAILSCRWPKPLRDLGSQQKRKSEKFLASLFFFWLSNSYPWLICNIPKGCINFDKKKKSLMTVLTPAVEQKMSKTSHCSSLYSKWKSFVKRCLFPMIRALITT